MTDDTLERILLDAAALSDVVSHLTAENAYRLKRLCAAVPELVAAVRPVRNPAALRDSGEHQ